MGIKRSTFAAFAAGVQLVTWAHLLHDAPLAGINHGISGPDVTCNFATGIASGVGGGTCIASPSVCNGTTDNTAAFQAFATWAKGTWQASHTGIVGLQLPPQTCKLVDSGNVTFAGIKSLMVLGYGSKLIGEYPHVGVSLGVYADATHSVRFNNAPKGATSLTINPAIASQPSNGCATISTCATIFTPLIGKYAFVGEVDLQNGIGFPINQGTFQYVLIGSVNTSTGVVTFSPPLNADYKSTYPTYNAIPPTIDYGGPATLFALHSDWDSTVEWRGITFDSTGANPALDFSGRHAIFRDVTCVTSGVACFAPTTNGTVDFISVKTPNSNLEADKEVDVWNISNSSGSVITFQSAGSFHTLNMIGSTYSQIAGLPSSSIINNSTITAQLLPGATSFGASTSLFVSNSSVGAIGAQSNGGPALGGLVYEGEMNEGVNNAAGWSMTSGVITVPNDYINLAEGGSAWMIPNANICWTDANFGCVRMDQITDITQDATNTYVHTTAPGGFPVWLYAGGKLFIRTHPMPQVTFTNVIGSQDAVSLSQAPAGAPLYSYSKLTLTGAQTANPPGPEYWSVWGNLKKLTINVTTPYAGVLSSTNTPNELSAQYFNSALSATSYTPAIIQLKSGGTRTLDASGGVPAAWTGTQSGDTLTTLSQQLWGPTLWRNIGDDISSDPGHPMSITVEVITTQNVVAGP